MIYKVKILEGALKQLAKLPTEFQKRIRVKIDDLAKEPRPNGVKKLKGKNESYRIKVSNYRVIYHIFDDVLLVNVVEIEHRSKVYKDKS